MTDYKLIGTIAQAAQHALFYEVALSPKPGLVDPISNGAHTDMDFQTFQISIQTLTPFFQKYIALGLTHKGNTKSLFEQLRQTGYQAEQAMLDATNDINTHKGANFSFAVILGAIGWHMQQCFIQRLPLNAKQTEQILKLTGELTHDLIKEDFHDLARKTQRTHGEELFWCMVFQVFVAKLLSVIPVLLPFFFPTYVQQTIMRPMKSFYVPWFY